MLRQSNCYNNDGSERVFLCGRMSQNIRGGKKVKRVKRVMVDVISLAKNVALHVW
jgi:hypothetical protein